MTKPLSHCFNVHIQLQTPNAFQRPRYQSHKTANHRSSIVTTAQLAHINAHSQKTANLGSSLKDSLEQSVLFIILLQKRRLN